MEREELKEKLIKINDIINKTNEFIDISYSQLKIDFVETELFQSYGIVLDMLFDQIAETINVNSKEKIFDTLTWYFFEYKFQIENFGNSEFSKETAKMWDENDNPICYDIDSLTDYLISL